MNLDDKSHIHIDKVSPTPKTLQGFGPKISERNPVSPKNPSPFGLVQTLAPWQRWQTGCGQLASRNIYLSVFSGWFPSGFPHFSQKNQWMGSVENISKNACLWLISLDVVASKWPRIASAEGLKARGFGLQRSPRWHTLRSPGHVVFVDMSGLPVLRKKKKLTSYIEHWKKLLAFLLCLKKAGQTGPCWVCWGSSFLDQNQLTNIAPGSNEAPPPWQIGAVEYHPWTILGSTNHFVSRNMSCYFNYFYFVHRIMSDRSKKKHPLKSYTPEA